MSGRNPIFYPDERFQEIDTRRQIENPYDIGSQIPVDLNQRNIEPIVKISLNLATASLTQAAAATNDPRWQSGQLEVNVMGRAFCLYGFSIADAAAALIRTVNTTALVWVSFERPLQLPDPAAFLGTVAAPNDAAAFPAKHSRGFRGPFTKLYLSWPLQTNVAADLIIHRYKYEPWVNGESAT